MKARMIQEFCEKDDSDGKLARFEKEAVGSLFLGDVREGRFSLIKAHQLENYCSSILQRTAKSVLSNFPLCLTHNGSYQNITSTVQNMSWKTIPLRPILFRNIITKIN